MFSTSVDQPNVRAGRTSVRLGAPRRSDDPELCENAWNNMTIGVLADATAVTAEMVVFPE